MPAQIITTDELRDFKMELLDEIKEIIQARTQNKEWLRSSELRKILKISPGTLQNLRVNGTLPYTKIGGVIYYAHEDVISMLEDNKVDNSL
ncbi:helix-turn-helix domain-containing protein [Reichenbachiella agariperforans]|uniref:helix-turn-helix domain-containing protein n=1 Tax=Reichenbachiella agariperforans TaxID=156994 RepID=UPI001C08CADD|nr:helix-turn-helix domain-containing protein [Reichenbachiella agariperforans]MBU2912696.1 helix-turn-helix domain-containing protein [Reichenbachiella agariperforans]